jgi:uncharacterized membrane protein YciS (DUF1049 family)
MDNLWLKIKFWTKLSITGLVALYIAFFIGKNSDRTAKFWYWYNRDYTISILVLAACSLLGGVIATLLIRTTFRTLRQFREMRSRSVTERLEREVADMKVKAAMLQTRSPTTQPVAPSDLVDTDEE